jgi:hypothetical protein
MRCFFLQRKIRATCSAHLVLFDVVTLITAPVFVEWYRSRFRTGITWSLRTKRPRSTFSTFGMKSRFFPFSKLSIPTSKPNQFPFQPVPRLSSRWMKRPVREADHPASSSAENWESLELCLHSLHKLSWFYILKNYESCHYAIFPAFCFYLWVPTGPCGYMEPHHSGVDCITRFLSPVFCT